jgi:ketosteroid isomerase-like protein
MLKTLLTLLLLALTFACFAQTSPEASIRQIMADQAAAWNKGNIDEFMKGYWNNDSLVFVGQSGLSYGYDTALAHYKKRYDSPDKMGQLFFTLLSIKELSPDYCFVLGKWLLKRKIGDAGGIYSLLFRKIDGRWQIVVDHTS